MRATVDTNVFVSALNFGGVPERLLDLLDDGHFVLCISPTVVLANADLIDKFESCLSSFDCRSGPC